VHHGDFLQPLAALSAIGFGRGTRVSIGITKRCDRALLLKIETDAPATGPSAHSNIAGLHNNAELTASSQCIANDVKYR
jgi:hypothetical protein